MTIPTFIMMCGLPASGKSELAKKYTEQYDANIHSSDAIRKELSGDINNQDINDIVFKTLHNRIKDDLCNGKNCICDSTNINYKRRKAFLQELSKIPCVKKCVLVATPYEECLRRNAIRDRKIPEEVIKRMYMNFNIPYYYEGFDIIETVKDKKYCTKSIDDVWDDLWEYDQCNSHHNLTLGKHLKRATEIGRNIIFHIPGREQTSVILDALSLHDISKPFCRTDVNKRGESDGNAHYFNHQYVSAYDSLFVNKSFEIDTYDLNVAIRVMWHMHPYFNIKKEKYRKLWGDRLWEDIHLMHIADEMSHK